MFVGLSGDVVNMGLVDDALAAERLGLREPPEQEAGPAAATCGCYVDATENNFPYTRLQLRGMA